MREINGSSIVLIEVEATSPMPTWPNVVAPLPIRSNATMLPTTPLPIQVDPMLGSTTPHHM